MPSTNHPRTSKTQIRSLPSLDVVKFAAENARQQLLTQVVDNIDSEIHEISEAVTETIAQLLDKATVVRRHLEEHAANPSSKPWRPLFEQIHAIEDALRAIGGTEGSNTATPHN